MFSGSLVAIVTPMHADGGIDWSAWERLLRLQVEAGTAGIVVGGTTGESASLGEAELLQLIERARPLLAGRAALIAGTGGSGTAGSAARARRLSAADVDALLVLTPPYVKPTQEGLYRHFAAVAEASRVPVVLYNVPGRTAVDLLPATVARLAALPNIVAIKEAVSQGAAQRVRELVSLTPGEFAVLSGDDGTCAETLLAGARGVISVTTNLAPRVMARLVAAALAGQRAEVEHLAAALSALNRALFVETSPIPVKWAMAEQGLIGPGLRLPLTPLSTEHHGEVREALAQALAWESAAPAAARNADLMQAKLA